MFILQNPAGNVVRKTASQKRREELLRQGYSEIDDGIQGATPYTPKKRGESRKTAGKAVAE